jgi:hypothetical protein
MKSKDFALIGAGPVGIYLSHLLIQKGHKVTLYEAGSCTSESADLNINNYIFETKSKIPNGVHRVGGGSNLWKRRISEFSPSVFTRRDENGNPIWPMELNALERANKSLFSSLHVSGLGDREYLEKHNLQTEEVSQLSLNLFRFCEENFFKDLLADLKFNERFTLKTKTLVKKIQTDSDLTSANNLIELELKEENSLTRTKASHSYVVLTAGCLQSTALVMRSSDVMGRLSASDLVGKYLMEHFDGYVGTLRINSRNSPLLKKFVLDEARRIENKEYGVGIKFSSGINQTENDIALHLELVKWRKTYLFDPNLNVFNGLPTGAYKFFFLLERMAKKIPSETRRLWLKASSTEIYSVWLKGEELPNFESELRLSKYSEITDAKLIYNHKVSNLTKRKMRSKLLEFSRVIKDNNLGKFRIHSYFHLNSLFYTGPNFHPMGTLKMGLDPKHSVVGSDFAIHGSPKVFAVNSGIFPNGSNHNPTAMVLALSQIFASGY